MKEIQLDTAKTIDFDQQNIVIALDKKFLKLNNGKPLEFHAKINENKELVLTASLEGEL